ncbi:MAG: hypothetical protein IJB03_07220 [Alistipes sp.]|nr:hypothetical protein [Alistipes sp.]
MNRLMSLFLLVSMVLAASCSEETDTPSVEFRDTKIVVSANGGELIVPVVSTGVDDVNIIYEYSDRWEHDAEGNLIPADGWIELVKVIDRYSEQTRTLVDWRSGIVLNIEPNTGGERRATLEVCSFGASKRMEIVQSRR